jgi:hypothetical protein
VNHPFHPWSGREFLFLSLGHNWGENRVFFLDEDGLRHSLPAAVTDGAVVDPFVALAAGRSPLRVSDLLNLVALVAQLRSARGERV